MRKLLTRLEPDGDAVVVHGLRGRASNRKLPLATQKQALAILQQPDWHDFGPTFAAQQLAKLHQIQVGKETLRVVDVYTDRDSMFAVAPRPGESPEQQRAANRLTQLGRALRELGIGSILAYSPQAKGRVERGFRTAQDRLVKQLRAWNCGWMAS